MTRLLACLLFFFISSACAESWHFDVYLDKTKIGKHTFDLAGNTLTSKAIFDVKILFINAYHYDHEAKEQWLAGCLQRLSAKTDDNGEWLDVNGMQDKGAFTLAVNQTNQAVIKQDCVMTFAYWNPKILKQQQLLNPQNADYLDTEITFIQDETITVKKQKVLAKHYRILGSLNGKKKLNIDLWYNEKNEWVQLKSTTLDGNILTYKLI